MSRLSTLGRIAALATAVVVGVAFGRQEGHGAFIPHLTLYALGDRGPLVGDVRSQLAAASWSDSAIAGSLGLALAACIWFYRLRASSRFGRPVADFILVAAILAVIADWFQNALLRAALPEVPGQGSLHTAIATAALIKCCAICVAVLAVPAAIGVVLQRLTGWCQKRRWNKAQGAQSKPWWQAVLAPPDPPRLSATDEAVHASGETAQVLEEKQQSWLRAYNVPGVTDALKNREAPLRALCLSGGGVRSACVAMGAMEVFSRPSSAGEPSAASNAQTVSAATLFDNLDYVVSVSGGGYAAGARLLGVQAQQVSLPKRPLKPPPAQKDPPRPNVAPLSQRFEEGSAEFDHLRRGSSYIADSPLDLVRALGQVLKNLLASLATVLLVPVIAGLSSGLLLAYFPIAAFPSVLAEDPACDEGGPCKSIADYAKILPTYPNHYQSLMAQSAAYWALGFFALLAVLLTLLALFFEWLSDNPASERRRSRAMGAARLSVGFALVICALTVALPGLMWLCQWATHPKSGSGSAFAAALSGVVGLNYVAALVAMIWRNKDKLPHNSGSEPTPGLLKRLLPPAVVSMLLVVATLAALVVVWLALLGSFAAGAFHHSTMSGRGEHLADIPHLCWWLVGSALVVIFLGFADVTSLSLHPFYRRRLAATFAVRRLQKAPYSADPYPPGEPTWLHRYGWVDHDKLPCKGPKFVFACSATITGTDKPAPGLNAVSYVMSADYVGGPDLGWFYTDKLYDASPARIRRDLTVEAAIAVSGAAFASSMGRQDKGIEKLLAISGARLGTWLPNPKFVAKLKRSAGPKALPSIRGAGYLYREILGINSIDAQLVQITDGGHYDNSGLVEALRRRCRLIIVIDGGGDPPPLASGLTDALRLAKYELGVDVALRRSGRYSMESISPGSGAQFPEDDALVCLNKRVTRGGVVAGTINYPAAAGLKIRTGTLVFAKAVVSQACPYWLLTYAALNEIFPHDPTSDQWFSEGQFAAYTALGRIIAAEALECLKYLNAEGCHRGD